MVEIRTELRDGTLMLGLPEEFCVGRAWSVLGPLARLLGEPQVTVVVVDMTATRWVNAEGLTVLRALAAAAADRRVRPTVVVPDVHLRRLLHVLEVDRDMDLVMGRPAASTLGQGPGRGEGVGSAASVRAAR